jgi:hypothetical protein
LQVEGGFVIFAKRGKKFATANDGSKLRGSTQCRNLGMRERAKKERQRIRSELGGQKNTPM